MARSRDGPREGGGAGVLGRVRLTARSGSRMVMVRMVGRMMSVGMV